MRCSRCGSDVPDSSRYCSSCGFDLLATTPMRALAEGRAQEIDLVREALAEEYDILEELGRGGMALVYLARERELGRDVAIKVLPFSLAFDQEFVERFQREARTAAQLEHPSIIPIYRVGPAGRVIHFVMKYLRGGSLAERLRTAGTLPVADIRRILSDTGAALGYAAQRGVVHRDIKPDNIMFDEFGRPVLTDFGIARAASGAKLTGTGTSIGTPHYMSPEQARAQAIDGRSDLYSLGVVAYQCLVGAVPYDGEDGFAIGYKHITEPLPVPTLEGEDERRLFRVIARMLAKDPADRHQSADDLLADLARGSGGTARTPAQTVRAPSQPAGSTAPAASNTPRRIANRSAVMKRQASSAWPLVILLLLAGGSGAAWWFLRGPGAAALAAADSTSSGGAVAPVAAPDSSRDSLPVEPATAGDTTAPAPGPVAPPATPRPAESRLATAPVRDSGAIRLLNLPVGSTVLIDEQQVVSAVTRLPVGRHSIAISAPQHNFFADTVTVTLGDTLDLAPVLTRLGEAPRGPAARPTPRRQAARQAVVDPCVPGAAYEARRCFDVRPRPLAAPVAARPAGADSAAPALFWVRVTDGGQTGEVRLLRTSGHGGFDQAARDVAAGMRWEPARRAGDAVAAWTQLRVVGE